MAKVDYPASAAQIVELVGGVENVTSVAHCVTRVRFVLRDFDIARANTEAISAVPGVIQVVDAGGQYQVVIGTTVEKMYDEVVAITGKAGGEVDADATDDDDAPTEKLNPFQALIKIISGVMVPILGAMTGCGIIASLATLLMVFGVVAPDSPTYTFLYGIGQTTMFFMPVLVGTSAAKYFKLDVYLGAVIGAALAYPVLTNAELAGQAVRVFGFVPVTYQAYTSTVFPALAAVAFGAFVNKWIKKLMPDMLNFVLTPALTLLVTLPISFAVIGPVVNLLSSLLAGAIMSVYNFSPVVCGVIINAIWLPIVVPMGIHQALVLAFVAELVTTGQSTALGLLCGITVVTGVTLGIWARSKDATLKETAMSTAVTNLFGISEPALYGVIMPRKEALFSLMIAGGVTGIIPALFHTTVYSMGASGLFGLPMYLNPSGDMSSFVGAVLTDVAALVVGFLVTYFWPGFDPDKK